MRRKRDELLGRWQDREKRLEAVRLKEKAQEERGRKRRRVEEAAATGHQTDDDEEAEFLLVDWEERDNKAQDALSGLSKESREVLERIGLGGPKKKDEDEDVLEEGIKVRDLPSGQSTHVVTRIDLLHVKNALATIAIYHGTATTYVSLVSSGVFDGEWTGLCDNGAC